MSGIVTVSEVRLFCLHIDVDLLLFRRACLWVGGHKPMQTDQVIMLRGTWSLECKCMSGHFAVMIRKCLDDSVSNSLY